MEFNLCVETPVSAARRLALLPAHLGGLGLQCAARTAPAVCWAAWADVLPVPARCLAELAAFPAAAAAACLCAAAEAGCVLDGAGRQGNPSWHNTSRARLARHGSALPFHTGVAHTHTVVDPLSTPMMPMATTTH